MGHIKVDVNYDVEVVKVLGYGMIVRMPDNSTELIHISNMSDKFVANVSDYAKVGDKFNALAVPGKQREVELSLKHLNIQPIYHAENVQRAQDMSFEQMIEESLNSKEARDKCRYDGKGWDRHPGARSKKNPQKKKRR